MSRTAHLVRGVLSAALLATAPAVADDMQIAQSNQPTIKLDRQRPVLQVPDKVKPGQLMLRPDCPDPGIRELKAEVLGKTTPFAGRIRITAVVENFGRQDYVSNPGQQTLTIMRRPIGGTPQVVRTRGFQNLASGARVQTAYEIRNWNSSSPNEGEFPPNFEAWINYDVDINMDGNEQNDDCRAGNNRRTLNGSTINDMLRP